MNGQTIHYTNLLKYLGVFIDPKLKFNKHIKNITKKCNTKLNTLSKISNIKGWNVYFKYHLYKLYIQSSISYAIQFWGSAIQSKNNEKALNKLINRAIFTLFNIPIRLSFQVKTYFFDILPPQFLYIKNSINYIIRYPHQDNSYILSNYSIKHHHHIISHSQEFINLTQDP